MTKTFSVNAQNDIFINQHGLLEVSNGIEAVLYACKTAAQAQFKEMIYNFSNGVANFQTVWRNVANTAQFEASVRKAILAVDGVTGIQNFTASVQNNQVAYSATIQTVYGTGDING